MNMLIRSILSRLRINAYRQFLAENYPRIWLARLDFALILFVLGAFFCISVGFLSGSLFVRSFSDREYEFASQVSYISLFILIATLLSSIYWIYLILRGARVNFLPRTKGAPDSIFIFVGLFLINTIPYIFYYSSLQSLVVNYDGIIVVRSNFDGVVEERFSSPMSVIYDWFSNEVIVHDVTLLSGGPTFFIVEGGFVFILIFVSFCSIYAKLFRISDSKSFHFACLLFILILIVCLFLNILLMNANEDTFFLLYLPCYAAVALFTILGFIRDWSGRCIRVATNIFVLSAPYWMFSFTYIPSYYPFNISGLDYIISITLFFFAVTVSSWLTERIHARPA